VDEPGKAAQHDRRPRLAQRLGVGLALVAQRVHRGGDHDGRRQRAQVAQQRRQSRVRQVGSVAGVLGPEPVHLAAGQVEAVAEQVHGRVPAAEVRPGIDQQLQRGLAAALVAQVLAGHRGEVAAGAVAADRHATGVRAELGGVLQRPAQDGGGVVGRRGNGCSGARR
jgi:hypothetical protein